MTEPTAFKYRAFLSYSHADTKRAKWLHGRLESFPIDKELEGRETSTGPIPKSCGLSSATATSSPPVMAWPSRPLPRLMPPAL